MFDKEFQKLFDLANKKNIDKFDFILSSNKSLSIKIFRQEIENFTSSDQIGLGVRVINGKKVGYAYTEKFDEESFAGMLEEALENSRIIEDEEVIKLQDFEEIEKNIKIYYPELEEVPIKDKKNLAMQLESIPLSYDKRVIAVPYAIYGDSTRFIKIANSEGLNKEYKTNGAYSFAYCLARGENMNKSGNYIDSSHKFSEINSKKIGETAAQRALDLLGAKNIESGKYPVLFHRDEAATMLQTFAGIFSAKKVQEGQSLLRGKLEQEIANNKVNIIDDALYEKGFGTRPFDGEGYPSQRTELIKDGVLTSYIHNTITAEKVATKSTGNASRSYKGSVGVSSSNLFFLNGNKKKQDLYKMSPKSIEIVSLAGMHSGCNPISGDFSLSAEGFVCDKDGRKYPIQNFTVSGNFLSMLQKVTAIADDLELNSNNFGSPSLFIEELDISG